MKITFFETTPTEQEYLSEALKDMEVSFSQEKLTKETAAQAGQSEAVSVFVNSEVKQEVMDLLPNLKFIATRSMGFDHIDGAYAKGKGITVSSVPAYGSYTVAEFTFALILNLTRKIFEAKHQLVEGDDFDISRLEGFNLYGKTLGVIGTGKIGKNVAKLGKAFGMTVLASDVHPDEAFAAEAGCTYVQLPELLAQSDIVTLHVPYMKETYHLLNKDNIPLMKKGAYLINTARGEIVETDALVQALTSGHLAAAGLDVLESERQLKEETELLRRGSQEFKDFKTLFKNHVLIDLPRVIVTPHIAFFTREAVQEILKTTVENIRAFLAGKPQNVVNA